MTARMTPIGAVVAAVTADLAGVPADGGSDRHVQFLRRHATVARDQHARSIAGEMETIAERLECAVRSRQIPLVPDTFEVR